MGSDGRIGVRINRNLYNHAKKRADAQFGGVITDYIKDLIRKDMSDLPTDPQEWMERIDGQIHEVQKSLSNLLKVKGDLKREIMKKRGSGSPGPGHQNHPPQTK